VKAAIARAAQETLERALLHCAGDLRRRTGLRHLCIAGGVGLNSVANGRILRESGFDRVFVVPAAGDNGISLGCAYYAAHELLGTPIRELPALADAYLGPEYPPARVAAAPLAAGLLLDEIGRARICDDERAPADVVRMGSRVEFVDEAHGEARTVRLVWPAEADIAQGRVSVMTPVGAGLIGLRPGQSILWPDRGGEKRALRIVAVAPPEG
jgi:transcription elongation GreA/GreB family factor